MTRYKLVIIFFIIVIIVITREEYVRRKFRLIAKSIKQIHFTSYLSLVWFYITYLEIPFNSLIEKNIKLDQIFDFILPFAVGILYLIQGMRTDIINDYGIITHQGKFKWKRILKYEWNDKINKKRNKEYYILKFFVKTYKLDKIIFGSDEKMVSIKIPIEYRGKVEKIVSAQLRRTI